MFQYGTLHIIDVLRAANHSDIQSLLVCGGLSRSPLFVQTQADVANLPVLCPRESESVLVGAAILGACAAGVFPDVQTAVMAMGGEADIVSPIDKEHRYLHVLSLPLKYCTVCGQRPYIKQDSEQEYQRG
jgi:ribulose kinase